MRILEDPVRRERLPAASALKAKAPLALKVWIIRIAVKRTGTANF
jgi:hypothetical protein